MKRLRTISERAGARLDEPKLSIAPLIDVCFLLLIYFMVTTTIKPAEQDLKQEIPAVGVPVGPMPVLSVMVHVQEDGQIVVNPGEHEIVISTDPGERDLPDLEDFLSMLMVGMGELPPLMVRADGRATHQRVVDVMNVLQKVGWARVGFLDERDEGDVGK